MKRICVIIAALVVAASCAKKAKDMSEQSIDELKDGIESKHPSAYVFLAKKLFDSGKKDEAVRWQYIAQVRYMHHLTVNPGNEPSNAPASLPELRAYLAKTWKPFDEYSFGDIPKLVVILDEAMLWEDTHANLLTPKSKAPKEYKQMRSGLDKLKIYIQEQQDDIKAKRKAKGLDNRS